MDLHRLLRTPCNFFLGFFMKVDLENQTWMASLTQPISAIHPSTRSLHDHWKRVFRNVTDIQTDRQIHRRTLRLSDWIGPVGRFSENTVNITSIYLKFCENMAQITVKPPCANSDSRQNIPMWKPPLYIVVTSQPIMWFYNSCSVRMSLNLDKETRLCRRPMKYKGRHILLNTCMSSIICFLSCVICLLSSVICCLSYVICHL